MAVNYSVNKGLNSLGPGEINTCLNYIERQKKLLKTGFYQEKQDTVQKVNKRNTQILGLYMLCAFLKEMSARANSMAKKLQEKNV